MFLIFQGKKLIFCFKKNLVKPLFVRISQIFPKKYFCANFCSKILNSKSKDFSTEICRYTKKVLQKIYTHLSFSLHTNSWFFTMSKIGTSLVGYYNSRKLQKCFSLVHTNSAFLISFIFRLPTLILIMVNVIIWLKWCNSNGFKCAFSIFTANHPKSLFGQCNHFVFVIRYSLTKMCSW
jgi:hypothetical protein